MRIHVLVCDLKVQPRRSLLVSSAALLTTGLPAMSQAGPLVIEETSKFTLTSPEPPFELRAPRIDGDALIVQGSHQVTGSFDTRHGAFVFERDSSGAWVFVRKVADVTIDEADSRGVHTALSDGVAAFTVWNLDVFERASGWAEAPVSSGGHIGGQAGDVEMSPGMILVGDIVRGGNDVECSDGGNLFEEQSGAWVVTHVFPGDPTECPQDIEDIGNTSVDISSDSVILSGQEQVYLYSRNADGSWPSAATSVIPGVGPGVAIDGDDALVTSYSSPQGVSVLRDNGGWSVVGDLQRPDVRNVPAGASFDVQNGIAAVGQADPHRGDGAGSIAVFQRNASGEFEYVAKLLASDATPGSFLGGSVQVSGRTIYGHSEQGTYVFELPDDLSQPALVQDDFQDRNTAEWTHIAGSNVSVVSSGGSFVYRQSSVAGAAGSTRTGVDMTNQGIEADVVPRSFAANTGERWFGFTVRQTDANNYYYLTMRRGNIVSLRKQENGVTTVLASASTPVTIGRRYKLRLEAVGSWIRAYVDGRLVVEAQDSTHTHGAPGLRMFKTAADYDNVVISPNDQVTLLRDAFDTPDSQLNWVTQSGEWLRTGTETAGTFVQSSLAGGAFVTTDVPAEDQVIQVRARATAYASGDANAQRWFGVFARMQDAQNYYYLTARRDNTISIRRLVNGQAVVLDSAPLSVALGTYYTLRLEAVGSALRGYVNGRLVLEANDSTFSEGSYGLATFRTRAQFDNFVATQP